MKALLCGYYGMGNGGDEALLASLLQCLPERVEPIVLSGNPAETSDRYQVEAVPRKSPRAVLSAMRRSDAFIWGGGSLMQDASSAINPLYYGGLMLLAQRMGLKTIAWAQGIGPLNRATSQWLTKAALKGCDGVSVRDRKSSALLSQWNQAHEVGADPVWGLAGIVADADLLDVSAPRIAVALRPHNTLTQDRLTLIADALVLFQAQTKASLVFIPFQQSRDLSIAQYLSASLSGPSQICSVKQPQQLKALFRQIKMTVGMRFHALIMAAAEGSTPFAISYDPKVDALAEALPLPGFDLDSAPTTLPPFPTDANALCKAWIDCYQAAADSSQLAAAEFVRQASIHKVLLESVL